MKFKLALLLVSAGTMLLGSGACFFRWLGDAFGDALLMQN
jgi:hypothetical protein